MGQEFQERWFLWSSTVPFNGIFVGIYAQIYVVEILFSLKLNNRPLRGHEPWIEKQEALSWKYTEK